jgi:hypothetical protein
MENEMARMPSGEPRTVPDPAGDLYDQEMAKARAQQRAEDRGLRSPLELAKDTLHDFQNGPDIRRPTTEQSFVPIVGPAWEAAADLQDGNYAGAAFNGAMAVADVLPLGVAVKGARAFAKGVGVLKKGSVTADASRKVLRNLGVARPGQEIHHTIPLKGLGRNVQDPRNHYAFLKVLPKEQHRRLTGSWAGKPRYDPIRRVWYGTTDWMKAVPASLSASVADGVENATRPSSTGGR